MIQTIKISVKNVYGVDTVYPACPAAVIFARIAGTKTLTHDTLCAIEALGYNIEVEAPRFVRSNVGGINQ
jgi:hypothetical protein